MVHHERLPFARLYQDGGYFTQENNGPKPSKEPYSTQLVGSRHLVFGGGGGVQSYLAFSCSPKPKALNLTPKTLALQHRTADISKASRCSN